MLPSLQNEYRCMGMLDISALYDKLWNLVSLKLIESLRLNFCYDWSVLLWGSPPINSVPRSPHSLFWVRDYDETSEERLPVSVC